MTKIVKIALIVAFIIFAAGITWALVANRDKNKEKSTETANTPTLVGTPSSTGAPAATPSTTPAPVTVAPKTTAKKVVVTYRTITVEEPSEEITATAWASAGSNNDGSSWAYAYAE